MDNITWDDFKKVEIRVETILEVNYFPEAIKPTYQVKVDLGEKIEALKNIVFKLLIYTQKNHLLTNKL